MRVVIAAEQLRRRVPGGIGRYATALLDELARASLPSTEVTLLASRVLRSQRVEDAGTSTDPMARWGFPVRASILPGPLLTRAWDAGILPVPAGFDIAHSVSLAAPTTPRRSRVGGGGGTGRTPTTVMVHDIAWRVNPEATTTRGRRWHESALGRALRTADGLIVPSTAVGNALLEQGARPETVHVAPLGADHLPPPDQDAVTRLLDGLGIRPPFLLSASTLEPRKNLRRLIAAYAIARPTFPEPWPLLIVGPSGWGNRGRSGIHHPAALLPDGVVLAGHVRDAELAGLYAAARVFAYVPLSEGYGLPPVEAMTFGLPVVASTGVPSVGVDGREPAAFMVEPTSVEAIADALVRAAVDETSRAEHIARGTALAAERRWTDTVRHHLDAWTALT